MALGFGFNKAKVLSSAEKYVQQGKLQNAIAEYEKVAKEDSKDLTVLNTIGDLYARLGQSDHATAYFRKVGDAYAADGFTVKSIAMYKKLTKLAPNSVEGLQKLAELYTQQGLYNDARQQYVALADHWMKDNDLEGAARVFQKMLELDPENAAMQSKLADLYIRMGKKENAKEIYFRAAESLYQRAAMDAADEALGRILNIDPTNVRALLKRGLIAVDSGDGESAARHLERIPNIDANPDALGILLRARLVSGDHAEGERVARLLATQHKDLSGIQALAESLMSHGSLQQGLAVYREFSGQLSVSNTESLQRALEGALHKVEGDATLLEIVRELYRQLGDKGHVNECSELLAHSLVQSGDLKRARDLYRELADSEPENPAHEQNYRQVLAKLGEDAAVRRLTPAEGSQAFMVDELEMTAPTVVQEYPEGVGQSVKAALTDSELLDSYNLPEKALAPLEKVLPQAPRDVRLNQRLASLYAAAARFADAARCCQILESVYQQVGHADQAKQYAEMAAKYAERAGVPLAQAAAAAPPTADFTVEVHPPSFSVDVEVPAAAPAAAAPAHEIDLSEEWETHAAAEPAPRPGPPAASVADLLAEIRFYISQAMWNEARTALERCQVLSPGNQDLAALQAQMPVPAAPAPAIEEQPPAEVSVEAPPSASAEVSVEVAAPPPPEPAWRQPPSAAPAVAAKADVLSDMVSDLDASLGADFAIAGAPAAPPMPVAQPVAGAPGTAMQAAAGGFSQEVHAEASNVLSDMFAEFKEDAEAGADQVEDPDTHYNLGVAFREMGLMDEAIGELQKVCHAIDKGVPFTQTMQAYTWLAQCFVEKGVPEASFQWYERALKIATDMQQRLSLHYDFGHACEAAGNRQTALQHFMEVYGSNIDYRDVAERIKALRS
ncbi:MAG: tetratricopeptide repeat protein [Acidobacteriia bacterium]|nr:tetratricopeptide repeat protein [Terriglobia bacterium]